MMQIAPFQYPQTPALAELAAQASAFVNESRAALTKRAYRFAWSDFTAFCSAASLASLPAMPETVALYVSQRASEGQRPTTLSKKLAAISVAHQMAGFESPTKSQLVRSTMAGIRRTFGVAPRAKEPLVTADIRTMLMHMPNTLKGKRDRALLLVGFAGGFRRGELVGLDVEELAFGPEGVVITLRRSKTDQEGAGRQVAIAFGLHEETCPVRSLRAWLDGAGITSGPVWRAVAKGGRVQPKRLSSEAVAVIVKTQAAMIGLDPSRFAGHSLRSGMCSAAAQNGASERAIMAATGHRSVQMVRRYIRHGSMWVENASKSLGL